MSLKFTGELCVMTMKNDAKFGEKLICRFKTGMPNLANFDPGTRKFQEFAYKLAFFDQSILSLS